MRNLPKETNNGVLLYILIKIVSMPSIYALCNLAKFASKSQIIFVQKFYLAFIFLARTAEKAQGNSDTFRSLRG